MPISKNYRHRFYFSDGHFRSGDFYQFYFSERQFRTCNKFPVTGFLPQNFMGNHFGQHSTYTCARVCVDVCVCGCVCVCLCVCVFVLVLVFVFVTVCCVCCVCIVCVVCVGGGGEEEEWWWWWCVFVVHWTRISQLIPSAVSFRRNGVHQVKRMIGGLENVLFSTCSQTENVQGPRVSFGEPL